VHRRSPATFTERKMAAENKRRLRETPRRGIWRTFDRGTRVDGAGRDFRSLPAWRGAEWFNRHVRKKKLFGGYSAELVIGENVKMA